MFSFIYKEIGLFSLLYFSITNIVLLVFITLLQETIKNDYICIKSAVLSCYMLITEIILITMFFRKMFKLLDSNYLALVYINRLKEDIYSNTKEEIISKYSCYLLNKLLKDADIKSHWMAINENEYKISVTENDIATIKDIKYKQLIKQIQKESKLGITVKAELGIGIAAYKNDAVITAENKNIEKIKHKLISSFQLSKWSEGAKFSDKEVLKTKLVSEINEHNYVSLKETLDLYESIYKSFINVTTIYSIDDEPEKYQPFSLRSNEWESISKLDHHIIYAFEVAVKIKEDEAINELFSFIYSISLMALRNRNYYIFDLYLTKYIWLNNSITNSEYKSYFTQRIARQLKEIIRVWIKLEFKNCHILTEKKKINKYWYTAFSKYSTILSNIIKTNDYTNFNVCIETLNEFIERDIDENYHLEDEITEFSYNNDKDKTLKLQNLLVEREIDSEYIKYNRIMIFGIYARLLFLYHKNVISLSIYKEFTKEILLLTRDRNDLLNDIHFINKYNFELFDWRDWDIEERKIGKVYTALDIRGWLSLGFVVYLLKCNNLSTEIDETIVISDIYNIQVDRIIEWNKKMIDEYDKWRPILNDISREELEKKIEKINCLFNNLRNKYIQNVDEDIISQSLSKAKINDFNDNVGKQWESGGIIKHIMTQHNLIEYKNYVEGKKPLCAFRGLMINMKRAFVERDYSDFIVGGDYGYFLSNLEDYNFHNTLISGKREINKYNDILDAINAIINKRASDNLNSTAIFLDSYFIHNDKTLSNSEYFIPSWKSGLSMHYYKGTYKNIKIIPIYKDYKDYIIICDLEKSIKMVYYENSNWYDKKILIEINEINENNIEYYYNKYLHLFPAKGSKEIKFIIKKSVELIISNYIEYIINNEKEYDVIKIENGKDSQ